VLIDQTNLYLIEAKHTADQILPSIGDIKDGLLKMVLYSNLEEVKIDEIEYTARPVLKLTSKKIKGSITSNSGQKEIEDFTRKNVLKQKMKDRIDMVFKEAQDNNFEVKIEGV